MSPAGSAHLLKKLNGKSQLFKTLLPDLNNLTQTSFFHLLQPQTCGLKILNGIMEHKPFCGENLFLLAIVLAVWSFTLRRH